MKKCLVGYAFTILTPLCSTYVCADNWTVWTEADFVNMWGAMPIENVTTMTLIEPGAVGHPCADCFLVGVRLAHSESWDIYGELHSPVILHLPIDFSYTSFDLAEFDLWDDPEEMLIGTMELERVLIAGTLMGIGGATVNVTGIATLMVVEDSPVSGVDPEGVFTNVFFTPDRIWDNIEDAVADIEATYQSFFEAEETSWPPTLEPACLEQFLIDWALCVDQSSERGLVAAIKFKDCKDEVGFRDRINSAGTLGGIGVIVGGGIGGGIGWFLFPVVGAPAGSTVGGVLGGLCGAAGGLLTGEDEALASCLRQYTLDTKINEALTKNCIDKAYDDLEKCAESVEEEEPPGDEDPGD